VISTVIAVLTFVSSFGNTWAAGLRLDGLPGTFSQ
jgi:hypothetical protein